MLRLGLEEVVIAYDLSGRDKTTRWGPGPRMLKIGSAKITLSEVEGDEIASWKDVMLKKGRIEIFSN